MAGTFWAQARTCAFFVFQNRNAMDSDSRVAPYSNQKIQPAEKNHRLFQILLKKDIVCEGGCKYLSFHLLRTFRQPNYNQHHSGHGF